MKVFNLVITVIFITGMMSCTLDKTDYEAELSAVVTDEHEFEEAASFNSNGYQINLEALNGTLFKGYNELRFNITETASNQAVQNAEITFLPIRRDADEEAYSCPHGYEVTYDSTNDYYSSYAVFDYETATDASWEYYFSITIDDETFTVLQEITVEPQPNMNLNMTAFTGNDGEQYYIALIAPKSPSVAENELIAGIYKYDRPEAEIGSFPDPSQFSYSEVQNATLFLDPRMPEPSMGNHSSPNNQDLTQGDDGLYYGVVNYTMTGNWTLNFILQSSNGDVIKGTEVPTDFTPGVEGERGELHIDILF
ncbi:FixH family protein [Allomuricauda sp. F6463D]|uniref:FixH family protein n=1 Tax=Allomuricauda sp. F6463D TaxID=2926409 RepID=UPI001FF4A586|nr:FixH family protein [Muricauda sp. F6463D]MCK0160968.1 FixH family protein [Muricauda sp. F6463D]